MQSHFTSAIIWQPQPQPSNSKLCQLWSLFFSTLSSLNQGSSDPLCYKLEKYVKYSKQNNFGLFSYSALLLSPHDQSCFSFRPQLASIMYLFSILGILGRNLSEVPHFPHKIFIIFQYNINYASIEGNIPKKFMHALLRNISSFIIWDSLPIP